MKKIIFIMLFIIYELAFSQTRVQQAYYIPERQDKDTVVSKLDSVVFNPKGHIRWMGVSGNNDTMTIDPASQLIWMNGYGDDVFPSKFIKYNRNEDVSTPYGYNYFYNYVILNGDTVSTARTIIVCPEFYSLSKSRKASQLRYLREWILSEEKKLINKKRP